MDHYKLLTPGPLTTSKTVKEAMLLDRCTWDDAYKQQTQLLRGKLLEIAEASQETYTTVFMQGSGTFAVESVLTTALKTGDRLLILVNGAYGERITTIAQRLALDYRCYRVPYNCALASAEVTMILDEDPGITHVAFVHCETTTGILNPLPELAAAIKAHNRVLIVDAMSSFGGMPIPVEDMGIDYLISSANKCIQGVPGFGFVIARRDALEACKGNAMSLSLDLYDQWEEMDRTGKWRFTSPTHAVAAFCTAVEELAQEGGVAAREKRYRANNQLLREKLAALGIHAYIQPENQSPVITTFTFPRDDFDFPDFYQFIKARGFVLYPGKLTDVETFRIGNIGEIYPSDIEALARHIQAYMKKE